METELEIYIRKEISKIEKENYFLHPYARKLEYGSKPGDCYELFCSIMSISLRLWGTNRILEIYKNRVSGRDIHIDRVRMEIKRLSIIVGSLKDL